MFRLRSSSLRAALVPWLVLLLLLAQGLRLCVPAETAQGHDTHAAVHLESLITSAADQHESDSHDGNLDLPLSAVLKAFQANPFFLALFVFVLILSFPHRSGPGVRSETLSFRPSRGYHLSPPLRAPPR
jgi:hypothetical protein